MPHSVPGRVADFEATAQAVSARDQTAADTDQTGSDLDHTAAEADQGSSDRDQVASDRDQRAADDDQEASDRSGPSRDGYARTRRARSQSALERDRASQARSDTAHIREDAAARRDLVAQERDAAASARDRLAASLDLEIERLERDARVGGRPAELLLRAAQRRKDAAAGRARAAAQREAAARDREEAALDRRQAALDRAAAAEELVLEGFDHLTGALRRGVGVAAIQRELDRTARTSEPLVVAFVDVDGLKTVNDELGHGTGDEMLRETVSAIGLRLRSYDVITRFGGDEFVCLLSGQDATGAAARFDEISTRLAKGKTCARFTVGFAERRDGESLEDLIGRADLAMTQARGRARLGPEALPKLAQPQ